MLLFLTKNFPFDKGEEFIEDEIISLSEKFDKIVLIATSVIDDSKKTRTVPENVTVFSIKASQVKKNLLKETIKLFPYIDYNKMVSEKEKECIKGSIKKRAFLTYFLSKSNAVYEECLKIVDKTDILKYDSVTFYSYWLFDTAIAILSLKKHYNIKNSCAVSRTHRYDLYADKNSLKYLPMRYYLLENLNMVYPCSDDGTKYLKKLYPKCTENVETRYLGTKDFGVSSIKDKDVFNIVSCCHISPVKRVDLLAKSLECLKDSGLKLKWTHFGSGEKLEKLKAFSKENLSFMDVNFYGAIKNADLMKYYKNNSADVFINTSSSEGLPVSIMEACSFGIPSIATDVGGTSEIVKNGETGYLIDADFKLSALASRIKEMASMPYEEKLKLREKCRKIWENNFYGKLNFQKFSDEIKSKSL
ncbi:glycosyltransferase [Clostridium sp. BJN0001]|uniref:glycosyltransferase n=1 Tax=Clostridium sp. BJN0001 TaxID=2930219 RepID=UPI001FD3EDD5|nr:glycosyltransferase [Clostridium sp. BJN0001]